MILYNFLELNRIRPHAMTQHGTYNNNITTTVHVNLDSLEMDKNVKVNTRVEIQSKISW